LHNSVTLYIFPYTEKPELFCQNQKILLTS
jgi:hypothetical protein